MTHLLLSWRRPRRWPRPPGLMASAPSSAVPLPSPQQDSYVSLARVIIIGGVDPVVGHRVQDQPDCQVRPSAGLLVLITSSPGRPASRRHLWPSAHSLESKVKSVLLMGHVMPFFVFGHQCFRRQALYRWHLLRQVRPDGTSVVRCFPVALPSSSASRWRFRRQALIPLHVGSSVLLSHL